MGFKGLKALERILDMKMGTFINSICIGNDKEIEIDYSSQLQELCDRHALKWFEKIDSHQMPESQISIAISWRWIISDVSNLIVFHDSLLPKYRGFAPLVSQLIDGLQVIGVTAIWANDEYDTGHIITQSKTTIFYPIKIYQAIQEVSNCYAECTETIFKALYESKTLPSIPQNHDHATYSLWRDDLDYFINWSWPASRLTRFIDAVGFPYKGAMSHVDQKQIIINDAVEMPDLLIHNRDVGKVINITNGHPIVVCGTGLLKIISAKYIETDCTILPLNKFRLRFSNPI